MDGYIIAGLHCEKLEGGSGTQLILSEEISIYLFKTVSSIEFNSQRQ